MNESPMLSRANHARVECGMSAQLSIEAALDAYRRGDLDGLENRLCRSLTLVRAATSLWDHALRRVS